MLYSAYAWGMPVLLLLFTLTMDWIPGRFFPQWFIRPHFGLGRCWYSGKSKEICIFGINYLGEVENLKRHFVEKKLWKKSGVVKLPQGEVKCYDIFFYFLYFSRPFFKRFLQYSKFFSIIYLHIKKLISLFFLLFFCDIFSHFSTSFFFCCISTIFYDVSVIFRYFFLSLFAVFFSEIFHSSFLRYFFIFSEICLVDLFFNFLIFCSVFSFFFLFLLQFFRDFFLIFFS